MRKMFLNRPILSKAILISYLLSLISLFLISYSTLAQTQAQIDAAKAKLGTMTPDQIQAKISQYGMTMDQAIAKAQQYGIDLRAI